MRPRILPALAAAWLAGCATLLPSGESETRGNWDSFEHAKAAVDRITPHVTKASELRELGLDPYAQPNVELLHFSDILRRFPRSGPLEGLEPGLRECLAAGKACTGYAIEARSSHEDRVGNFLLDFFSFQRETRSTGWTFNALVLVVGDDVVYCLYGGKPSILGSGKTVTPLGPLQDWNGSGLIP